MTRNQIRAHILQRFADDVAELAPRHELVRAYTAAQHTPGVEYVASDHTGHLLDTLHRWYTNSDPAVEQLRRNAVTDAFRAAVTAWKAILAVYRRNRPPAPTHRDGAPVLWARAATGTWHAIPITGDRSRCGKVVVPPDPGTRYHPGQGTRPPTIVPRGRACADCRRCVHADGTRPAAHDREGVGHG